MKTSDQTAQLKTAYFISTVILLILISLAYSMLNFTLLHQTDDARVINISGRQRMLSQRITHLAIQIDHEDNTLEDFELLKEQLEVALNSFEQSHSALKFGHDVLGIKGANSQKIIDLFAVLDPDYQQIATSAYTILQRDFYLDDSHSAEALSNLLAVEHPFLTTMDSIVFQYAAESSAEVVTTRVAILIISCVLIATVILEGLFIFKPSITKITALMNDLALNNEEMAKNLKITKESKDALDKANKTLGDKNDELMKLNTFMVGRELKMVDLKKLLEEVDSS